MDNVDSYPYRLLISDFEYRILVWNVDFEY